MKKQKSAKETIKPIVKTQFSIETKVKNRLDRYKAERKEDIIDHYGLKRRHISNTKAIEYLLDKVE